MRRNPYVIMLLVIGVISLVIAFTLVFVLWEVTGYDDVSALSALGAWITILIGLAVASLVGVLVIAGVAWSLRKAGLDV